METTIPAIEVALVEIQKLTIAPGEFLILRMPESWTPRQIAMFGSYLKEGMKAEFPEVRVLVLPYVDISVGAVIPD